MGVATATHDHNNQTIDGASVRIHLCTVIFKGKYTWIDRWGDAETGQPT